MKKLDIAVWTLLAIGGVNWGLVGLFNFNLVETLFRMESLIRLVYVVVGLAAVYDIVMIKAIWKRWDIHFHKPAPTG